MIVKCLWVSLTLNELIFINGILWFQIDNHVWLLLFIISSNTLLLNVVQMIANLINHNNKILISN